LVESPDADAEEGEEDEDKDEDEDECFSGLSELITPG
jgi:hypothetical protein